MVILAHVAMNHIVSLEAVRNGKKSAADFAIGVQASACMLHQ
jgi:hypothetical protein